MKKIKSMDRIMLSMFVKILKSRKEKDERTEESIDIIVTDSTVLKRKTLNLCSNGLKANLHLGTMNSLPQ